MRMLGAERQPRATRGATTVVGVDAALRMLGRRTLVERQLVDQMLDTLRALPVPSGGDAAVHRLLDEAQGRYAGVQFVPASEVVDLLLDLRLLSR